MKYIALVITVLGFASQSSHAEQATAPILLLPVDATKNVLKDAISLTWQKPSNESTAKVLGYRIIVSENSRFFGYSSSSDSCNNSCQVFIEDKSTFKETINVKLANKPYYWKVQAISPTGNGDWSTINTFQTQKTILIPTITNAWANPAAVLKGNSLTFSANLDVVLPEKYSVKLDYGNGLITMTGSGTNYSVTQTPSFIGKKDFTVGVYDAFNKLKGSAFSNSFTVIKGNEKPIVNFVNSSDNVTTGTIYTAKFSANDVDGNLSAILIDWGDGATDALDATNNETKTFSHTYQTAGTYSIIANAIDNAEAKSDDLSVSLTISDAPKVQPIPTISSINVSPQSVVSGNSLTFSASLSANLPTGYSVKINYGNGLVKMNGSGTSFNLTAPPTSSAAYKIGIYDGNNTLKGSQSTGNFSVTQPAPVNVAPSLSFISGNTSATTNTNYSVQLQAADSDNNLSSIAIDWGDGASDSKAASNYSTLTFSHIYNSAATYNWSATAYDSDYVNSNTVSKNVAVSKPVVVPPVVTKTTGYTKIANNGSTLSDSAKLGANPTDWACTKDNKTGLIWEVKTDDSGLRDKDWYYSWYKPEDDNGGNAGYTDLDIVYGAPNCSTKDNCNTYAFTNAVNKQGLCGAKDWRMPTNEELQGLVYCSDGKYNKLIEESLNSKGYGFVCSSNENGLTTTSPTINATYFPDIKDNYWFWSSSPSANDGGDAWGVNFGYGYSGYGNKYRYGFVRLVR